MQAVYAGKRALHVLRDRGNALVGAEAFAAEPTRQRDGRQQRMRPVGGKHRVALLDMVVAAHHAGDRPSQIGAQGAERGEVLVAELAPPREAVGKLPAGLRMRSRPDEVRQARRIVPVPRLGQSWMQVDQGKAAMGDEQAIGKEQGARSLREQAHRQLAGALDPFMREVGVQDIREIRRRDARGEPDTVIGQGLVVVARDHADAAPARPR